MSWHTFPLVECPHCEKAIRESDYLHFQTGDSFECPECEEEIYIKDIDWNLAADLGKEK